MTGEMLGCCVFVVHQENASEKRTLYCPAFATIPVRARGRRWDGLRVRERHAQAD